MTAGRLAAARVVTPGGLQGPSVVVVDEGRVVAVEPATGRAPDRTLVPGFVDLQVNGIGDVDVATAEGGDWERLDRRLLAAGVTTWCPTLVTAPLTEYADPLRRIGDAARRPAGGRPHVAGAHLEGPFIARPGAHAAHLLRSLDLGWLDRMPDIVRLVTLAPELPGAVDAVRLLTQRHVLVALGHSEADDGEVVAAVDAGARLVTHLFNAMPSLHHRRPGLVGAALAEPRLVAALIADLEHVHPTVLRLTFATKGASGVALVSDAVATDGAAAPRRGDGVLAGAAATLDRGVANAVHVARVPLVDAVVAASSTPARLLGLGDRGQLAPGARADVVALDPDLAVTATWVGGELAWGDA